MGLGLAPLIAHLGQMQSRLLKLSLILQPFRTYEKADVLHKGGACAPLRLSFAQLQVLCSKTTCGTRLGNYTS